MSARISVNGKLSLDLYLCHIAHPLLRLTVNRPLFSSATAGSSSTDSLEAVKFICKDVWIAVWDKQVDNLRTNHRVRYPLALACAY